MAGALRWSTKLSNGDTTSLSKTYPSPFIGAIGRLGVTVLSLTSPIVYLPLDYLES